MEEKEELKKEKKVEPQKEPEFTLKVFFRSSEKVVTFYKVTSAFINNFINALNNKNEVFKFITIGNVCINKEEINHFSWSSEGD